MSGQPVSPPSMAVPDCLRRCAIPNTRYALPSLQGGQTVVAPFGGPGAGIPRGPLVIVRLLPSGVDTSIQGTEAKATGMIG
jgi:hypothetical protein